jgi:hypothetical protein
LSEQTQAVESLAEEGSRQASSLKTIAGSARQQATASAQIAASTDEVRGRLSELVRGNADQSASFKAVAEELRGATAQLSKLRRLQTEQAETLNGLASASAISDSRGTPGAA